MRQWGDEMNNSKAYFITRCALLCAVAVVLSMLESMLPAPVFLVPGCRLGLANLAVIIAIPVTGSGGAFLVVIVKAMFIFVTRGVTAGLMSLSGGLVSLCVMLLLFRCRHFGFVGVSVASAAAHNTAQLAVAALLMSDIRVFSFVWLYLLLSIVTGALTGTAAGIIIPPLSKALKIKSRTVL
ncbi:MULTISPECIES: Gx transporter family protein [unclassified Ruminococcus]|uniref:Gx transporter family protein n=1 Tax=unclassified Ruminococcus TaxID=2608920 RepID=UPI00210B82F7|nr:MULTISPECIES: Gx transporter family protein [unclassified Ruminococcus]MCQ4022871.1 heptaprenyl diphosphate synthase [Ruminococcus sp. zg-924]MCQ4115313.1 heptaprenyl diphosphate synthase [Ruminococcus sp. zg-921]